MSTNNYDTNVANNVAQSKVQDLTEQWKKGELEAGWYYVLLFSNEEYITFIDGNWVVDDRLIGADIKEVLAPVPSYEEWKSAYECQIMESEEVTTLKDVISKMCMELVDPDDDMSSGLAEYFNQDLLLEIHEVLK